MNPKLVGTAEPIRICTYKDMEAWIVQEFQRDFPSMPIRYMMLNTGEFKDYFYNKYKEWTRTHER